MVPPRHPLAGEAQVSIRQLGAESFVAHIVPSPYREKVIQTFQRHKTPLHMDVELPTLQAIKRFVAMGNGVALVPAISVENELTRGELVRIPVRELRLHRKLRLVYRKAASLSHAARAFLKVAEAAALERRGPYRFQRERRATGLPSPRPQRCRLTPAAPGTPAPGMAVPGMQGPRLRLWDKSQTRTPGWSVRAHAGPVPAAPPA